MKETKPVYADDYELTEEQHKSIDYLVDLHDLSNLDREHLDIAQRGLNWLAKTQFAHSGSKTKRDQEAWLKNFRRDYEPFLHGDYEIRMPLSIVELESQLAHSLSNTEVAKTFIRQNKKKAVSITDEGIQLARQSHLDVLKFKQAEVQELEAKAKERMSPEEFDKFMKKIDSDS